MIFTFLIACFTGSTKVTDSASDPALEDTAVPEDTGVSMVNQGPEGSSLAQGDCGPADDYFIRIDVNVDQIVCEAGLPDQNWSMGFNLNPDFSAGEPIPIGENSNTATFNYEVVEPTVDGEVILDFDGTWQDQTDYSGYYWVELSSGLIIEGAFEGVFCDLGHQCG